MQGFLCYRFKGADIWRGLFSEFYGIFCNACRECCVEDRIEPFSRKLYRRNKTFWP